MSALFRSKFSIYKKSISWKFSVVFLIGDSYIKQSKILTDFIFFEKLTYVFLT